MAVHANPQSALADLNRQMHLLRADMQEALQILKAEPVMTAERTRTTRVEPHALQAAEASLYKVSTRGTGYGLDAIPRRPSKDSNGRHSMQPRPSFSILAPDRHSVIGEGRMSVPTFGDAWRPSEANSDHGHRSGRNSMRPSFVLGQPDAVKTGYTISALATAHLSNADTCADLGSLPGTLPLRASRQQVFSADKMENEFEDMARNAVSTHEGLVSGLPQGWPATVRMRRGLESMEASKEKEMHAKLTRENTARRLTSKSVKVRGAKGKGITTGASTIMSKALDPDSRWLHYRDCIGAVVLLWDMILSPFLLAFKTPLDLSVIILLGVSAIYWAVDMALGFRTGFYYRGHLQMQPVIVAKHYLSTHFPIDLLLLVFDVAAAVVAPSSPRMLSSRSRFVLIPKLLRVHRLFHFTKRVFRTFEVLFPFGQTAVRLITLLSQVILGTLLLSHFMTCAWYGIGSGGPSDTGMRWLEVELGEGPCTSHAASEFYDVMPFSYLTAYHWSLAQITLGAMEVMPTNSYERLLSIFLLLFGLIFGSIVISLVSSQTMEYVMLRREQTQKLSVLRTFLKQHAVDSKLAARVTRQVTSRLADHSVPLSDQDVPALTMLSTALRTELLRETRFPWLISHPLFRTWADLDKNALEALSDEAVRFVTYVPQDVIFIPRTNALEAFLVVHGMLRYSQDSETSLESQDMTMEVKEGAWITEAALWTHWTHVGKLEAEVASQLLQLSSKDVLQILNRYTAVAYVTRYYGRNYHIRVISAVPPHAPWPNDLQVPFTDPSDLLTADVGITLLEQARKNGMLEQMSSESFLKLTQEVQDEVCAIQQGEEDEIQRIVALVAFRLHSVSGRLLVQLGKADSEQAKPKPSCQLPGTKRARGEMPSQAMEKLLNSTLKNSKEILQVDFSEEHVEVELSESYGIETKYLKTVYTAHLEGELAEEECADFEIMQHDYPEEQSLLNKSDRYRDIVANEVFIIKEKKKRIFFAWLPSDDFDYLKSEFGHPLLAEWLSNLVVASNLDDSVVELAADDGFHPHRTSRTRVSTTKAISGSIPVCDMRMTELMSASVGSGGSELSIPKEGGAVGTHPPVRQRFDSLSPRIAPSAQYDIEMEL